MASGTSIVSVGLGSSTIKVAEFLVGKGGLTISKFVVADLGLDPNKEENRAAAISTTLQQVLKETGIKTKKAILSMSGQTVFMKVVKLPPVDAMQVDQMVGFEAQQNVPFPIEEVIWDYQLLKGRNTGETEAIIVAMKSDLLEIEHQAVEMAGLQTSLVDVAPLALYNCFLFNYDQTDGCSLIIDLGARTTNLLFIEGGRLFTRPIPIAGNQISQNICNEFQEPFIAAETMKKGKGFVNLGGAYADPDDKDSARISKLVRSTMTRLHTEINRSITFYKTQHGGTSPKRVLLTGGTALLPYADIFLSEKLGVQVEFLNPLRNVNLAPGISVERLTGASYLLAETVGAALRATGTCPIEIDLSPKSVRQRRSTSQRQPLILSALAAWTVACSLPFASVSQEMSALKSESAQVSTKVQQLALLETQMKSLEKEMDNQVIRLSALKKLSHQRSAWVSLLSEINGKVPEGVWITQLTPSYNGQALDTEIDAPKKGGPPGAGGKPPIPQKQMAPEVNQIDIRGLFESSYDPSIINQFVTGLAQTGKFDLTEKNIAEAIVSADSSSLASNQISLNYQLSLKLKNPIDVSP
jgi:type IV pilus assembly protein PilM